MGNVLKEHQIFIAKSCTETTMTVQSHGGNEILPFFLRYNLFSVTNTKCPSLPNNCMRCMPRMKNNKRKKLNLDFEIDGFTFYIVTSISTWK